MLRNDERTRTDILLTKVSSDPDLLAKVGFYDYSFPTKIRLVLMYLPFIGFLMSRKC